MYYVTSLVASNMQQLDEIHWKETKSILHYVQCTREFGIHYSVGAQLDLVGFTNSDWAGDNTNRKYKLWFVFMLGLGPIS